MNQRDHDSDHDFVMKSTTTTSGVGSSRFTRRVHIRLNRAAFNAGARVMALPPSHPLHRVVKRCQRVPMYHRSAIHHLLVAFPLLRGSFETINPGLVIPPAPPGSLSTTIAMTKDAARAEMEAITQRGGFCVYTDGSGYEGGVGAAAVAWNGGEEGMVRTKHLGSENEHTVFESEVVGAILALDIIKATPRLSNVDIFTDCQPAITALGTPRTQPGQYLLSIFHTLLRRLRSDRPALRIRIHWVPAHIGIPGNEAVDARAKEAALGASSLLVTSIPTFSKPLPTSKAAVLAAGVKHFRKRWLEEWRTSPRFARLSLFDNASPGQNVEKMYAGLTRPQCSVLTQLRTSHIGLNAFLYRFHLGPSPDCPLCLVPETVPHFLLACPKYHRERLDLICKVGTARLSLRLLLGVKSDPKPVLAFVRGSGRLPRYSL